MRKVRAAFISLLVRRGRGLAPGTAAETNHEEEIVRSGQVYGGGEQSIEKLRRQWAQFMSDTFRAIAAEEMRLRGEELRRRIGSNN
jgi:hypothetical protein